jgi:bacillolysin
MKHSRILRRLGIAVVVIVACIRTAEAQRVAGSIPSLTERGEELIVRDVSPQTGYVTFASSPGRGILLEVPAVASAESRALAFIESYGRAFGLTRAEVQLLRVSPMDSLGIEHVRLQQVHAGVPVRGGELIVHLKGSRVMVANGHTTGDLPKDLSPRIPASVARDEARRLIEKHNPGFVHDARYSAPRLEIFNRGLLSETGRHPSYLAWFVEASGPMLRQFIWIDARSGAVLMSFSQLNDAKSRTVYTANHTSTLPGTLVRSEGGAATGDNDQDNAYTFAGITYDYYQTNHGRDSYDNAGATLISTAHYCENNCPSFANAFWNGAQMVYGDTYSGADDVVGHELTHAVTEKSSNLIYYNQSGALNESYSDIFGETVDLTDGVGNDAAGVRWKLGEDLPIGAIRDMMNPNAFSDPGRMSDSAFFVCSTHAWDDPFADSGGVHSNSGIPNHAYALMVDGGTYNGKTVTGIGLTKAAKIEYRALTSYLVSGSNFIDNHNALSQSCTDLIGTAGIAAGDCTQVGNALLAVEMNATWACSGATPAPAMCAAGTLSSASFEGFETGLGNWTEINGAGSWGVANFFAKGGVNSEWGDDIGATSDIKLSMTAPVTIPAGGRLYFDHAFEFESDTGENYDGGVLEYSTNGGGLWNDAASLIDAGKAYGGTLDNCCGNPLATRPAFVKSSFGYTGTRLSLATLAGQNVQFRFRIGTDSSVSSAGWFVDNISLYTCVTNTFTDDPLVAQVTPIKRIHVIELRTRIDALRIAHGLLAFNWTDPTLTAGTSQIKAVHITEMRTALSQAYIAAGAGTGPTYTDPGLATGTSVRKVHIDELRAGVLALE